MVLIVGCIFGFQAGAASPEQEAFELTRQLRQHDPYANVISTQTWQNAQMSSTGSMKIAVIQGPVPTGYIGLKNFFSNNLCQQFRHALIQFKANNIQRMIVDIRGNPGGQRMNAVCIAGLLVGERPILGVKGVPQLIPNIETFIEGVFNYNSEMWWFKSFTPQETTMPMVLIQDRQSQSAAEILSGALRDYRRAWITGTRSYGKGRTQEWAPLRDRPDLMMAHTIQQFFSPLGLSPEGVGVKPTVLPKPLKACIAGRANNSYPQVRDKQVQHALSVLDCVSR